MEDKKFECDLDDFIENELKKDIDHFDSIDPSVNEHISSMGWLWDKVNKKLQKDKHCFDCKKDIAENEKMKVFEPNKVERGCIAFVSICEFCANKLEKKEETKDE